MEDKFVLFLSSGKHKFEEPVEDNGRFIMYSEYMYGRSDIDDMNRAPYQLFVETFVPEHLFNIVLISNGGKYTTLYSSDEQVRYEKVGEKERVICAHFLTPSDICEIEKYVKKNIFKMTEASNTYTINSSQPKSIGEILANCPAGTKLYSLCYGDVIFDYCDPINVGLKLTPMIHCHTMSRNKKTFFMDGTISTNGEVMLFPAKENRDWSTFVAPVVYYKTWEAYKESNKFDLELQEQLNVECDVLSKLVSLCLSYNQADKTSENKYSFNQRVYTIGVNDIYELVPVYRDSDSVILPFNTENERDMFMENFKTELNKIKRFLPRI